MNKETQILNWLKTGISQSPNSLNESFYYDKTENEFFSILVTDYLLLDEDLNIAKNTTTSYSQTYQNKIIEKVKKVEKQDATIIPIPRLSNKENKSILHEFIKTIQDKQERTHLKETFLQGNRTKFSIKYEISANSVYVDQWNRFKDQILKSKAQAFLNLNNIIIEQTNIWLPDEDGTISIDLTNDDNGIPLVQKSKWWTFWKRKTN